MKGLVTTARLRCALGGVVLLALATLPAADATAQTADDAFRFADRSPGVGARMIGMAGAGIAGLPDYGAFFANPAGLGYYRSSSVGGALTSVYAVDEAFYQAPGGPGSLFEEEASTINFSNLAYVYRAPTRRGALVVGAALNQVRSFEGDLRFQGLNSGSTISTTFLPSNDEFTLDGNNNLDALDDIPFAAFNGGMIEFFPDRAANGEYPFFEAVEPGTTIEQTGSVFESGQMTEASFGGAVEAAPGVMVGLSANFAFGSYEFVSIFEEFDINDENGPDQYSVLLDDGTLLEGFNFLSYRQRLNSDLLGANLRLGLSARASRNVQVGVTIETPTFYTINEDFGQEFETEFDVGGSLRYGGGFDDAGSGEFEYEIRTPWRLGLGIGFRSANVTLMGDLELVDWSQLELDAETDRLFFADLNRGIEEDYDPVVNTRLGIEYRVGALLLRGGVAYQPDPLNVSVRRNDGAELDRSKTFVAAGFGYRFQRQIQFDFGWMQRRSDNIYSAYPEGPLQDAALIVDEEVAQNQFVFGLSVFF